MLRSMIVTSKSRDIPAAGCDMDRETTRELIDRIDRTAASSDLTAHASIPATFTLSATVVRFLRSEPLLPTSLTPADWPADQLRRRYDRLEHDLQATLRDFLRTQRD